MYGHSRDPAPKRTIWADVTKGFLDEIKERKRKLDEEERDARARCNHTYEDGTSALKTYDDWEQSRSYTTCDVCGQH